MKKIFFILIFIYSCDDLGVEEFQESFSYYDYLSYGWAKIFENDMDYAKFYFDESLNEDVTYYNNAIVGMGWTMTYLANNSLSLDSCNDGDNCIDLVDQYRNQAKCFFVRAVELGDLSTKKFDDILNECSDNINLEYANIDFMNLELTNIVNFYKIECEEDPNGNVEYVSCFENFILDMQVAYLYLEYLEYQSYQIKGILECNDIDSNNTCDELDSLITLFIDFLDSNPNYDITNDKAIYPNAYNINHKKIEARISQFYLDSNIDNKLNQSCVWAKKICDSIECELIDNQIDTMQQILDCIDTEF